MIGRARESRNPKKVIRVTLMESYGEIGRVPVNLFGVCFVWTCSTSFIISCMLKLCKGALRQVVRVNGSLKKESYAEIAKKN